MKTLRQEIEKLIEEIKSSTKIKSENIQWDDGWDVCANSIKKDLTDILSRHTEPEPTAPVQDWAFILSNAIKHLKEEEIAGLCFDLYLRSSLQELIDVKINRYKSERPNCTIADGTQSTAPSQRERIATALFLEIMSKSKISACELAASQSVTATDALIAELKKSKTLI